jgi:hypothetical protein
MKKNNCFDFKVNGEVLTKIQASHTSGQNTACFAASINGSFSMLRPVAYPLTARSDKTEDRYIR